MASPVGHTILGIAVSSLFWKQFAFKKWVFWGAVLLFANLADFDYFFGFFTGNPNAYHRLWTHSFGFVLFTGIIVLLRCRMTTRTWDFRWPVFVMILMSSHLIIDYLGMDTRGNIGIPLFWPISSECFISPVSVFRDIHKSHSSHNFVQSLFSWYNGITVLLEVAVAIPFVILIFYLNKLKK